MKQEMMEWQWHQLDHTQIICTSLQRGNHASTSSVNFLTGRMLFLTPNQQCQITKGELLAGTIKHTIQPTLILDLNIMLTLESMNSSITMSKATAHCDAKSGSLQQLALCPLGLASISL